MFVFVLEHDIRNKKLDITSHRRKHPVLKVMSNSGMISVGKRVKINIRNQRLENNAALLKATAG